MERLSLEVGVVWQGRPEFKKVPSEGWAAGMHKPRRAMASKQFHLLLRVRNRFCLIQKIHLAIYSTVQLVFVFVYI